MAQNYVQPGGYINAAADSPADPASGEAVRVGTIAGVAGSLATALMYSPG